jgi:hypothetical protein
MKTKLNQLQSDPMENSKNIGDGDLIKWIIRLDIAKILLQCYQRWTFRNILFILVT